MASPSAVATSNGLPNPFAERFPFQQLHNEKRMPRRLAHVVHGTNVRMIERRGCACFSLEAFSRCLSLKCLRQDLYRNVAMQSSVPSAIHFAHTALSERGKDLVRTEFIACRYRHEDPSLSRRAILYRYNFWVFY